MRGVGGKADVLVVDAGDGPMIVKDFAPRAAWARLLGAIQIAREARAYRHLQGVEGVPRLIGTIDRCALAIERIPGERLAFATLPPGRGSALVATLRRILDGIHARGVVHNDLRGRENVLLRDDGSLAIVDFAGAMRLAPGGLMHRLVFAKLAVADEAAFLKWKGMLAPGTYTPDELRALARFERWRALWPFNPKRRKARGSVA